MLQEIKEQFRKQTVQELNSINELLNKEMLNDEELAILVDRIFNITHQISGTAPMLGYETMPNLSRKIEKAFYQIRAEKTVMSTQFLQQTKRSMDTMISLLNEEE